MLTPRVAALTGAALLLGSVAAIAAAPPPALVFPDASGPARTLGAGRQIDPQQAFFQPALGTNGRTCGTCHRPENGWSLSSQTARALFNASRGLDPLFRTNDGSNSPLVDVSTFSRRRGAYTLL